MQLLLFEPRTMKQSEGIVKAETNYVPTVPCFRQGEQLESGAPALRDISCSWK